MRLIRIKEVPGEYFKYEVGSESDPAMVYLVDLTERAGNGICSCIFFATVANPNFNRRRGEAITEAAKRGERLSEEEALLQAFIPYAKGRVGTTECKHIKVARDHLAKHRLRPLMAQFVDGWPSDLPKTLKRFFAWPGR